MGNKFTEKRENVRTCLSAHVAVKRVTEEYAAGFSGFFTGMNETPQPAAKKSDSDAACMSNVIGMLLTLDEKIDRILAMLARDQSLIQKKCDALDISGSGICVLMPGKVETGDTFEVTVRFTGNPLKVLKTCAEAVRISSYSENMLEVGMKFIGLGETERENIIALTFSENRKRIRAGKDISGS